VLSNINYYILYSSILALVVGFVWGVFLIIENIKFYRKLPASLWQYKFDTRNRIFGLSCGLLGAILLIAICILFMVC